MGREWKSILNESMNSSPTHGVTQLLHHHLYIYYIVRIYSYQD